MFSVNTSTVPLAAPRNERFLERGSAPFFDEVVAGYHSSFKKDRGQEHRVAAEERTADFRDEGRAISHDTGMSQQQERGSDRRYDSFPLAFMSESHPTPFAVFDGSGTQPHSTGTEPKANSFPLGIRIRLSATCCPMTVGASRVHLDRETPVERTAQRLSRRAARRFGDPNVRGSWNQRT